MEMFDLLLWYSLCIVVVFMVEELMSLLNDIELGGLV